MSGESLPAGELEIGGVAMDASDLPFEKVRKKPVVVEAVHLCVPFRVGTLEGTMKGEAGDYLMRGLEGELYPCAARIYEASYDSAEEGGGGEGA